MKTTNKTILLLAGFISSMILLSCSSVKQVHIEKRRYMDGYYVDVIKRNNATKMTLNKEIEDESNAVTLFAFSEQKTDEQKMQTEKETFSVSAEEMTKQNAVSGQFTEVSNNKPTAENQKKLSKIINKKNLKKEIKSNLKEFLPKNKSLKSVNSPDDSSNGLTLMIVGGALDLLGFLLVFGPISISSTFIYLIGYPLIVAGTILFVVGLINFLNE